MNITDLLRGIAQKAGIDPNLFISVAEIESNLHPDAIGDQGTSFGLFQLHRGGQAPTKYSDQQLLDPVLNAQLAIPGIREGLEYAGSFQDTSNWFYKFAVGSGHPGYDTTLAHNEAEKIKAAYDARTSKSPITDIRPITNETDTHSSKATIATLGETLNDAGIELLFLVIGVFIVIIAFVLLTG